MAYWRGSLLVFAVLSGIAVIVALNVKRIYRSEVVVLVKPAMRTDDRDDSPTERAMKLAPKLKDTLLTRSRLEPIIKEFQLYTRTVESKGMVDAVEEMRTHVGFRGRDSETFVISFEDEHQERTRAVTQRLADTMMAEFQRSSLSSSKQQAEFLASEQKRVETEVENASRALATFLAAHPEFAADPQLGGFGPRPGGAAAQLPGAPAGAGGGILPRVAQGGVNAQGDPQLYALYKQKARLEAELRGAAGAPSTPTGEGISGLTKARDEAAKRAAQAQAELAERRTRYTDQHPDVVAARAQAESAGRALKAAQDQLESGKGTEPGSSAPPNAQTEQKLAELRSQIEKRQAELQQKSGGVDPKRPAAEGKAAPESPIVALETEWQRLLRTVADARAAHDDIERRAERANLHASATEALAGEQMEIIDPAYKPMRPARGGRTNTALAGLGAALFIAVALAILRVLMSDIVIDVSDIEALGLIPVLGAIPRVGDRRQKRRGASSVDGAASIEAKHA